jgi:hypothetical protein
MYNVHIETYRLCVYILQRVSSEANGHGTPTEETLFHIVPVLQSLYSTYMDLWNRRGALFSMGKTTFMSPQTAHKRESDGEEGKTARERKVRAEFLGNLWGLGTELG